MLTGTVTDQTATGRRNDNYQFDFTLKGTPAIGDDSMGRWMEYLFENQAKPTNATGVPVSLDTIDPNGNYVHIGTVTSDINGNFGLKYTPEVPGSYQIIATFAGSRAYSSSTASTYMSISETQPTNSPAPTAQPASMTDTYVLGLGSAAIIAIKVIGLIIILMLRKRP